MFLHMVRTSHIDEQDAALACLVSSQLTMFRRKSATTRSRVLFKLSSGEGMLIPD